MVEEDVVVGNGARAGKGTDVVAVDAVASVGAAVFVVRYGGDAVLGMPADSCVSAVATVVVVAVVVVVVVVVGTVDAAAFGGKSGGHSC